MPIYKVAMVLGLGGAAWWYYSSSKDLEKKQADAVEKFGRHGEKTEVGADFKASVDQSGPPLPLNAPGRHKRRWWARWRS